MYNHMKILELIPWAANHGFRIDLYHDDENVIVEIYNLDGREPLDEVTCMISEIEQLEKKIAVKLSQVYVREGVK